MEKNLADSRTGILHWPVTRDLDSTKKPCVYDFPGQKQQRELGRLLKYSVQRKRSVFAKNLREPEVLMCWNHQHIFQGNVFSPWWRLISGMLQKHTSIHVLEHGFSWYISALWILKKNPVFLNWITVSSCDGSRSPTIWSTCQSNNIYNHTGVDFQWIGYT